MELDLASSNVVLAAVGIAALHTIVGPDHYLPFVMIARARRWSRARTLLVTGLCGVGHVLSSLLLGLVGVLIGVGIGRLEAVESMRGDLAAWALVAFGVAYAVWGARRALRTRRGLALHEHGDGLHLHSHGDEPHGHRHGLGANTTFWALFIVFVLGPCEPLIPLFILPASQQRWAVAGAAALAFTVVTIGLMLALTAAGLAGFERLRLGRLERWSHSLAGGVIAVSGLAVIVLGI